MIKDKLKKIDEQILKKHPFQWIMAWHIFLPIIILLALTAMFISFIAPSVVYTSSVPYLATFTVFMVLISLIVFIYFIVRQIKFNSFRIHHYLPFSNGFFNFISFWLISLLLAIIPFLSYEAYTCKVKNHLASITDNFDKDMETLNTGLPYFNIENNRVSMKNYHKGDSYGFVYPHIQFNSSLYSQEEAIKIIEDFITVAKKYDIKLKYKDAYTVYQFSTNSHTYNTSFTLLKYENEPSNALNHAYWKYKNFLDNYDRNYLLLKKGVISSLLIFSSILALLLWIFVSVKASDFGFAILYGSLISLFVGIIMAIIGNDFEEIILYLSFIIIFALAFTLKRTRLAMVFKILSHVSIIGLLTFISHEISSSLGLYSIDEYIANAVYFLALISTVIFYNLIYRNEKILP